MKTYKKKSGIFSLLVRNYIALTLALVLVLIALVCFFTFLTFFKLGGTVPDQIKAYENNMLKGHFDSFPAEKLLGSGGFIAVLDQEENALYNPNKIDISVFQNNLSFVKDFLENDSEKISVTTYTTNTGDDYYEFTYTVNKGDMSITEIYLLDKDGNLLYCPPGAKYKFLTREQFSLLSQSKFENYNVSKYTLSNQNTILLFQSKEFNIAFTEKLAGIFRDSIILFLIIYIGMILAFILWLKQKITKPLTLLCDNIDSFEIGDNVTPQYKGPREFTEIFDSFSNLAKKLAVSEERRKKVEAQKQKMLADISHDLKTPITVIEGYTKALCEGLIPQENQKMYLETINLKANNLNGLINTFFEYSKLEHPEYTLTLKQIDICSFFRTYLADKYTEIEASGFIPDADIPEEEILVNIDLYQMQRVFDNVIANALKHNPKGTELYFALVKDDKNVLLIIGDNGVGIPKEVANSIFTPFVVGEASRRSSGSGLGLAIAQKIVDAHHGDIILVQDNQRWKTTFEISLPICES
ncbi:MAG: HAMP domain-containing sensor histidine kinase [Candidatus Fimivivens sp.]|nr:HAMP domain-containing sensor histidine kinase [Candidatus Fimivivens sp.]